jgi:hypothetical protein
MHSVSGSGTHRHGRSARGVDVVFWNRLGHCVCVAALVWACETGVCLRECAAGVACGYNDSTQSCSTSAMQVAGPCRKAAGWKVSNCVHIASSVYNTHCTCTWRALSTAQPSVYNLFQHLSRCVTLQVAHQTGQVPGLRRSHSPDGRDRLCTVRAGALVKSVRNVFSLPGPWERSTSTSFCNGTSACLQHICLCLCLRASCTLAYRTTTNYSNPLSFQRPNCFYVIPKIR